MTNQAIDDGEWFYGPLDAIAATHRFRSPCRSPITPSPIEPEHATRLHQRLELALLGQTFRVRKYGQDAEEWPDHHTPPEVCAKYKERVRKRREELEAITPSEDGSVDDAASPLSTRSSSRLHTPPTPLSSSLEGNVAPDCRNRTTDKPGRQGSNDRLGIPISHKKRKYAELDSKDDDATTGQAHRNTRPRRSIRLQNRTESLKSKPGHEGTTANVTRVPSGCRDLKRIDGDICVFENRSPTTTASWSHSFPGG